MSSVHSSTSIPFGSHAIDSKDAKEEASSSTSASSSSASSSSSSVFTSQSAKNDENSRKRIIDQFHKLQDIYLSNNNLFQIKQIRVTLEHRANRIDRNAIFDEIVAIRNEIIFGITPLVKEGGLWFFSPQHLQDWIDSLNSTQLGKAFEEAAKYSDMRIIEACEHSTLFSSIDPKVIDSVLTYEPNAKGFKRNPEIKQKIIQSVHWAAVEPHTVGKMLIDASWSRDIEMVQFIINCEFFGEISREDLGQAFHNAAITSKDIVQLFINSNRYRDISKESLQRAYNSANNCFGKVINREAATLIAESTRGKELSGGCIIA